MEATICARDFEIHVDLLVDDEAGKRADELERGMVEALERHLFARDERPVEELVLALCRARGWTLATAESCTGGLVAARLTSVPGASDVVVGGIVAYANEVKGAELGVPAAMLAEHGAVSPETAAAMATGVRARLGADVGISTTGVAGPGGRDARKAGRPRLPACRDARGRTCARVRLPGRPRVDPPAGDGRVPPSRQAPSVTGSGRAGVTSPASVEGDAGIRLFCALSLPDDVLDRLVDWQRRLPRGDFRVVPRENLHLTLAFLGGRPARMLDGIRSELERAAAAAEDIVLRPTAVP